MPSPSRDGREPRGSGKLVDTLPRDGIVPLVPQLRAFARSLTGGDQDLADDVVQDAVMLALRSWHSFTPGTNFKAWLLKIAHNRFYALRRRRYVSAEVARDDLETLCSTPPPQESALEVAAFKRGFRALSPAHREVLVLVGVHGLSYGRVAQICGCEVGTVKSRVNRARGQLKAMLLGDEPCPSCAGAAVEAPDVDGASRGAVGPRRALARRTNGEQSAVRG